MTTKHLKAAIEQAQRAGKITSRQSNKKLLIIDLSLANDNLSLSFTLSVLK